MWESNVLFVFAWMCVCVFVYMVLVVVDHDVTVDDVDDDVVADGDSVAFGKVSFQFQVIMLQG